MKRGFKRVIQVELNEVSLDIVKQGIAKGELPNFAHIDKSWQYSQTTSETEYKNLEPWIQWVSVHTGLRFDEHRIFHLGDATQLDKEQIWETLSRHNIESAIIGSMNGHRGTAKGGVFFPDPWMPNGETYPPKLQHLWNFISRRVQTHATNEGHDAFQSFRTLETLFNFRVPLSLYAKIGRQMLSQKIEKSKSWKMASLFDELLFSIFENVLAETNFGFYTLFLNSMAHYQHHYWRQFQRDLFNPEVVCPDCGPEDNPMAHGMASYDRLVGKILGRYAGDADTLVMIVTGLSQLPYVHSEKKGGMHYYRLKDHSGFVQGLGVKGVEVWPMMSRDWQISSDDARDLDAAFAHLNGLSVEGEPLFKITKNSERSYFMETNVTSGTIADRPILRADGTAVGLFHEKFKSIAVKSGYHSGLGSIWLSQPVLEPGQMPTMPLTDVYRIGVDAFHE